MIMCKYTVYSNASYDIQIMDKLTIESFSSFSPSSSFILIQLFSITADTTPNHQLVS